MNGNALKGSSIFIEISSTSLKALHGEEGLEVPLETKGNARLSPASRERLQASLRAFLKNKGWGRPRALCAIGARGVSLRQLTLPRASKEEQQRLLTMQVESEFPLPPEQLAWGYREVDGNGSMASGVVTQEVLVVAVKREFLDEYSELLSQCGLQPVFTLGTLASSSVCPATTGAYAVLDIGRHDSELMTFENNAPSAVRVLAWGGENLTSAIAQSLAVGRDEAERIKLGLGRELRSGAQRSALDAAVQSELEQFARLVRNHWKGRALYLAGATAQSEEIRVRLGKIMGPESRCQSIEVAPGPGRSAAIRGLKHLAEANGSMPPVVLEVKSVQSAEARYQPEIWKWAALALVLAAGSLAFRYAEPVFYKGRLARKISEVRAYRDKLPNLDGELNFLQHLKTNQSPFLDTFLILGNAAPPGARIDAVSLNRRGELSLRASMKDAQQAVEYRAKLMASGFFTAVVLDEQTPSPDRQKLVARITAQIKPASQRETLTIPLRPKPSAGSPKPGDNAAPGRGGMPAGVQTRTVSGAGEAIQPAVEGAIHAQSH